MTPYSTMAKLLGTPPRIFVWQITDNESPDKTKVDSHSFWLIHPRRRSEFSRTRLKSLLSPVYLVSRRFFHVPFATPEPAIRIPNTLANRVRLTEVLPPNHDPAAIATTYPPERRILDSQESIANIRPRVCGTV